MHTFHAVAKIIYRPLKIIQIEAENFSIIKIFFLNLFILKSKTASTVVSASSKPTNTKRNKFLFTNIFLLWVGGLFFVVAGTDNAGETLKIFYF